MYEEQYPVQTSPRPFGEIPELWLKVTQMTEAFFAQEVPRASSSNTLIGIVILAVVTAVLSSASSALSLLTSGSARMAGVPPEYADMFTASAGSLVVCSLCGGLLGTPLGFYLGNGVTYLGARIFGGNGDFGTQTYLQSLFAVPIGVVTSLLSLVQVVPYVGPCAGGLAMLALSAYAIVLNVRALKVAHNLTTGQAVAALFVPGLVIGIVMACLVIMGLVIMGPVIGNIFSNIVGEL